MTNQLLGKVAIVTGGAQGIGAAFARGLAQAGAAVCVFDLSSSDDVVDQIRVAGGQAMGFRVDVTDGATLREAARQVAEKFGTIDILVNNAAIFSTLKLKPFLQIDTAEWEQVLRVNVIGPVECSKAVLPYMEARGYGKIINITSGAAFNGPPVHAHYNASKGALVTLTRTMARELGKAGVRVNAIAPGFVPHEQVREAGEYSDEIMHRMVAIRALPREQLPSDLVGTVLFLASAASDFMTGQTLVVDGGSLMR